jgi:hypothetical protein
VRCFVCGATDHWEDAQYCYDCGASLANRCINVDCAKDTLPAHYRFCPACGEASSYLRLGVLAPRTAAADDGGNGAATVAQEAPEEAEGGQTADRSEAAGSDEAEMGPPAALASEATSWPTGGEGAPEPAPATESAEAPAEPALEAEPAGDAPVEADEGEAEAPPIEASPEGEAPTGEAEGEAS